MKKDTKIEFIKNSKLTNIISVFLKDSNGSDIQVRLMPGEFVYSQTNILTNTIRIYSKKGIINIKEEKKPEQLKYYAVYKSDSKIQQVAENPVIKVGTTSKSSSKSLETILDKAVKDTEKYTKKKKNKKHIGRPRKRGPKKGFKKNIIVANIIPNVLPNIIPDVNIDELPF